MAVLAFVSTAVMVGERFHFAGVCKLSIQGAEVTKMLKKKVKPKKPKPPLITFKVTEEEKELLEAKAKKYARGNLSHWLRHAGLNHEPAPKELA